jgi:hypothetical protein
MFNNQLVQLIPQVVSTCSASMSIVDTEEGATRPELRLLELRLDDVQDDRHTVFVVITDDALVGVCCVGGYYSVTFARVFGRLITLSKLYDTRIELILNINEVLLHRISTYHLIRSEPARVIIGTLLCEVVVARARSLKSH